MTTDYVSRGGAAMERLRHTAADARRIQREQLRTILAQNAATAYGSRRGFSHIRSLEEFQDRVPLSCHQDYEPYIQALLAGGTCQLTAEEPVYFAITSGSTGTPKYVPVTETDMRVHYNYIHWGVCGMVREHYPDVPPEALFGKIFQVGEFAKTHLPGGQMCGVRSASLYQWLDRAGGFDASDYCVPKEVLFPDRVEDLTYVKVRFALAERGLTAIHSVFLHRVVGTLDYIRRNWDLLLRDMETGAVDSGVPLSAYWRQKLRRWLPPDPRRAAELRALHPDIHPENMVTRIWPNIRYIVGIGGETFPVYTRAMARYAGGIPIHYFIYGASEGFLSIAAEMDVPDAYLLLPEAGFFEVLSVPHAGGRPLTMEEVTVGGRYELIFTNHSGLYRYRMQDVLEVVGFRGQAPVVRFCYRINQALNVADEKLNTEQLGQALRLFQDRADRSVAAFCAQEDFSHRPGRYLVYLECPPVKDADPLLDRCLQEASLGYRGCRTMGDIDPPRVRFLPPGSFQRYEAGLARRGRTMAQYKPVQILREEESRRFFAAQADGWEEKREP